MKWVLITSSFTHYACCGPEVKSFVQKEDRDTKIHVEVCFIPKPMFFISALPVRDSGNQRDSYRGELALPHTQATRSISPPPSPSSAYLLSLFSSWSSFSSSPSLPPPLPLLSFPSFGIGTTFILFKNRVEREGACGEFLLLPCPSARSCLHPSYC